MTTKIKRLVLRYTLLLFSLLVILFVLLAVLVYNGYFGHIPDDKELATIKNIQATEVVDRNGELLGKFYYQDRSSISISQMSPYLPEILVAIEDKRFYEHNGIDYRSLARVFVKSILFQNESSGGGSTISQQLVKNIYPRIDHNFLYYPINKLREMLIAKRLERLYSKNEIIELYLNTVPFGLDIYGIESASQRIFSRPASELDLVQSATLIGMLKATTAYNPLLNPERALLRRNIVLAALVENGYIEDLSLDELKNTDMGLFPSQVSKREALYFLNQVKTEAALLLKESYPELNIQTAGLTIHTTLDFTLQKYAEESVAEHIRFLQKKLQEQRAPEFWNEHENIIDIELRKLGMTRESLQDEKSREMGVFSWEGDQLLEMNTEDSIKYYLDFLQTGFLAAEPATGKILSWVGGIDPMHFTYDHVQSKRQVGSIFKPFIYAAALEKDLSPCTYFETSAAEYEVDGELWRPENSGLIEEEELNMAQALERSVNTVTVKLLQEVGIKETIEIAKKAGIRSNIPEVPSIALGTPSLSLLEMIEAYTAFANGGTSSSLYYIHSIEDSEGHVLYKRNTVTREPAFSKKTGQLMKYFLQEVVNVGTASELRSTYGLKNDLGGKTGTTQNNSDGWFIGISPALVAGAWVGGEYPSVSFRSSAYGQGARMALPIYAKFYQKINNDPNFRWISNSSFNPLDKQLQKLIDCDPFRFEFNFWDWMRSFRKDRVREFQSDTVDSLQEKNRFFDRVRSIFKKKEKK